MNDFFYDVLINKLTPYIRKKQYAMDIGCGLGWLTRKLASESINVLGIDVNPFYIEKCEKEADRQKLEINYSVNNIERLSENEYSNSFDLITCHNVLGYVREPGKEINKLSGWLKKDGIVSIVLRNPASRVIESYVREKNIEDAEKKNGVDFILLIKLSGFANCTLNEKIQEWLEEAEMFSEASYGLSTLFDLTDGAYNQSEEWKSRALNVELKLSEMSPFFEIASYWLFIGKKIN